MKKYEFTGETKEIRLLFRTATLHRIRATVAFGIVEVGDLGGWIEKEENLSHEGKAWVWGNAEVWGKPRFGAIGSRNDFTTFYRDKDNEITVKCGCFLGKIDRFLEKVTQTHGDSKYALVYRAAVEVAKLQIDLSGEAPKDADEE